MTAAEKRARFVEELSIALTMPTQSRRDETLQDAASYLTFTDDEPATPADWRDGLSDKWKRGLCDAATATFNNLTFTVCPLDKRYSVFEINDGPTYGSQSDPATLCAALEHLGKVMEGNS